MTEFQVNCFVLSIFSLVCICAYLCWRVRSLQVQLDDIRHEFTRYKMRGHR